MKRSVMTILAVLAGCAAWLPAQAKEYVIAESNETATGYIDRASLTRVDASTMSVWIALIFHDAAANDGIRVVEALYYIDCSGRRSAMKTARVQLPGEAQPAEITKDDNELEYEAVEPDTPAEAIANFACGVTSPTPDRIVNADSLEALAAIADASAAAQE